MRKLGVTLIIIMVAYLLFGCQKQDKSSFFSYQENAEYLKLEINGNEEDATVILHRSKETGRCTKLTYLMPKEIEGLTFKRDNGTVKVSINTVELKAEGLNEEELFAVEKLFTLKSNEITNIEKGEGNTTVARGKNADFSWQIITDEKGIPREITASGKLNCTVKVIEIK